MVDSTSQQSRRDTRNQLRWSKYRAALIVTVIILLNMASFWTIWRQTANVANKTATNKSTTVKLSEETVSKGWVVDYVQSNSLAKSSTDPDGTLDDWVDGKITARMAESELPPVTYKTSNITEVTEGPTYTAGAGIVVNGLQLSTSLGSTVEKGEIGTHAVELSNLDGGGCNDGQVLKFDGTDWACALDEVADLSGLGGTANRLALFSLSAGLADSYLTQDGTGLSVDSGKDLHVGGTLYGDGSGLSNLDGAQLVPGSVSAASLQDGGVGTGTLADGAVTGSKLADGAITFDKIAQNGCAAKQIIAWSGSDWGCADDADSSQTAGSGLLLVSGAFEVDPSYGNNWAVPQTFSGGATIGGNTYTNLAGNGLSFNGGVLSSTLGTSISASELGSSAVTTNKLADGSVTRDKIGQDGCTNGQTLKWNGSAWACADDADTNTTYTAGTGLNLASGAFSVDTSATNTWAGNQTFSGGATIGGNTYTNLAGTGLSFSGGTLNTTLGTSIDSSELADGSVTNVKIADGTISLGKLGQNGCAVDQVFKWNGSAWVCSDADATTSGSSTAPSYSAGAGLLLSGSNVLSLDSSHVNDWAGVQTFDGGLSLNGNTYMDLAGTGLSFNGGVLSSTLGTSITTSELTDGAVTGSKLAGNAITLDKLAQNSCTTQQTIKWNGTAWACANDIDTNTTYSAGSGLSLVSGSFAVDFSQANNWAGLQTFSGGLAIGGNTYTNLTGTGLSFSGGTLSSTLGTSIDTSEVTDGAITSAKILDGTITNADVADATITATKLAQSGCSNGNVLKWQTNAWVCTSDVDTTYSAGTGLSLNGTTHAFSLDTSAANSWTAAQSFGAGLSLNGNTYTNLAGTGLSFSGGTLSTTLGTSVDTSEITDGAITDAKLAAGTVTLDKLAQNSCTSQQTIKWNGTAWACANDIDTNTTYTAGTGLTLTSGAFSTDTTAANNWSSNQTFGGGLTVGGNAYTNLAGTGLSFSGGTLSSTLGTSIDSSEITDGTIATADLADGSVSTAKLVDGAVTLAKLGQNGCTSNQILKWNGTAWACASDVNNTYTAGAGLSLTSNSVSLDLAHANSWSGLQTFGAGLSLNGNTYTDLVGSGLSFSGGVLSSALGTSIDSSKITDGTIATADLADGSVTSAKILDATILSADLADNAVTSAKILDGTITGADISSGTITAGNIADGTITATKLATAARKRVVNINVSIAASLLTTQEQAIFVAPTNGTITKVTFTSGSTIISLTNQGTISVERKTATAATVASLNLSSIGMTALTPTSPTLGSGLTFNTGDLYTFKYAPGILGVTLSNMLVSLEYTVND